MSYPLLFAVGYLSKIIGILVASFIATIHAKNVHSDILTVERASISHRKYIPTINIPYKIIAVCVLASAYCFISNMVMSTLSAHSFMFSACRFVAIWGTWHYNYAKMFMYLVFLIRLYVVYNETAHRYNENVLFGMCVFVVCLSTTINVLLTFDIKPSVSHTSGQIIPDAVSCSADLSFYLIPLIALYDLGISIVTAVLFIVPLKRSIKTLHGSGVQINPTVANKLNVLIEVGRKNAILAGTAACTTFILMSLVGMGLSFISSVDFVVNIVCMVLMTPYYPDARYYEKICCGVIQCSKVCCCCFCGRGITGETLRNMSPSVRSNSKTTASNAINASSMDENTKTVTV
eukprot:227965_1